MSKSTNIAPHVFPRQRPPENILSSFFNARHSWPSMPEEWWSEATSRGVFIDEFEFLRPSIKYPNLIAVADYPKSIERGHWVCETLKLGKYLTRIGYGEHAADLANLYSKHIEDYQLHFATTASEIRQVYDHGPESCMSKDVAFFCTTVRYNEKNENIHPCEVYATGDFAVAYVKRGDRVVSRAVVNPTEKTYAVYYGNSNIYSLLREEGYESTCCPFDGLRLVAKRNTNFDLIAPYIDGDTKQATLQTIGGKGYLVVDDEGDIMLNRTDGIAGEGTVCDDCGEIHNDGEQVSNGYWICVNCISDHWCQAINEYGDHEYCRIDDAIYVEAGQDYYTEDCVDEYFVVDYQGEYIGKDDAIECYFTAEYVESGDAWTVELPNGREVYCIPDCDDVVFSDAMGCYIQESEAVESWVYPE